MRQNSQVTTLIKMALGFGFWGKSALCVQHFSHHCCEKWNMKKIFRGHEVHFGYWATTKIEGALRICAPDKQWRLGRTQTSDLHRDGQELLSY